MRQSLKVVVSLGLAMSAAGCSDYLSGPGVDQDPNNVINLERAAPLYVGMQAAGPPQRQGFLARLSVLYTQQLAGVARQAIDFDLYGGTQADTDLYFGAIYGTSNVLTGGGGLLDIHKLQQIALAGGDSLYVGIGKVYEAMFIGYAADLFGDIPYRQAADSTITEPTYDPQLQVYADLQAQLDSAINIFLAAAGPTNQGPAADGVELIYQGRDADGLRAVYTAVAHSLKARLYLHTAEVVGLAAYQAALAEVPLGIASPADDFLWYHDQTPVGRNIWWQFNQARQGDIAPGAAFIEIMKDRVAAGVEDLLRLNFYFTPAAGGDFFGFRPGATAPIAAGGGVYDGTGDATGSFSGFGPSFDGLTVEASGFRHPEITYAETQLIGAEAAFQTGGQGAAQPFLDAARTNRFYGAQSFGNAPGVLPATLENIIEEKYTTLFLNPEVWNDYKRTCLPSLAPAPTTTAPGSAPRATPIAGRVPYGQSEQNANPNVPDASSTGVAITATSQNPNDPTPCPVLDYTGSTPLAN